LWLVVRSAGFLICLFPSIITQSGGFLFHINVKGPFGWNYKPAEKQCWLIFYERKILFRLKKQAEKDGL
jgi:hypothetical protein